MESLTLTNTQLVMLACAPTLMVVVTLFERRWGPQIAGIVAAAPITALIGLLLVHSELGATASHEMGLRMGGYVPAQIAVVLVVSLLVARARFVPSLLIGIATYAAFAALSAHLPIEIALTISVLLAIVGHRIVPTPAEPAARPTVSEGVDEGEATPMVTTGALMIALRATVSLVTALALLLTAQAFGPAAGGAIGAFPVFTFTLSFFVYAASGAHGVRRVLAGMVQGLPPYFSFVLTFGLTVTHLGALGATIAGTLVCTSLYLLLAWSTARTTPKNEAEAQLPANQVDSVDAAL